MMIKSAPPRSMNLALMTAKPTARRGLRALPPLGNRLDGRKSRALWSRQQFAHHRLLFLQFIDGGFDLRPAELVSWQGLHDLKSLPVAPHRERANQILFDAVTSIRTNTHTVPISGRGRLRDRAHAIDDGIGRAGCPIRLA